MKKILLALIAALAALAGIAAVPSGAGAATTVGGGGGSPTWAPAPGTGPQAGEVPLGSFVSGATTRGGGGFQRGPATGYKVNPTCAVQCITGGVAYGRGPDARLVVTTDTPASIRIIVSGPAGFSHQELSAAGSTSFSADFDLEADTLYQGTVIATDANGDSAVRAGSFRTLERNVSVFFNEADIHDAPYGDDDFDAQDWFEGEGGDPYDVGALGALAPDEIHLGARAHHEDDTDRYLSLGVELTQIDESRTGGPVPCEVEPEPAQPENGPHGCTFAATAWLEDGSLDLDDRPAGSAVNDYWIGGTLVLPNNVDDPALPGGYGAALDFSVPVGVHVTWTT